MVVMLTLIAIGLIGGLVTGISPCILPVLPVILLSGTNAMGTEGGDTDEKPSRRRKLRPYLVIAGLVVSFTAVTLIGSLALTALGLPQDTLRWIGLAALILIGIGLIVPRFEELLERPFTWLPTRQVNPDRSGFGLGLALGAVFVPCAGPVLAAIVLAGASANFGVETVVLTLSFAIGATFPLLIFALAGSRLSDRLKAFRQRQRRVRTIAGAVMLVLAIALALDLPQFVQRVVPDYTRGLQEKIADSDTIKSKLDLSGLVNDQNKDLDKCTNGATELEKCGIAPDIIGTSDWFNTPDGGAIDLKSLRGKVVLIDFWAYSCINCQRSIPHVTSWYDAYRDKGFEVIGIHSPEYAFEKDAGNVRGAAQKLGIEYPVALDNGFSTWTNYRNRYWPAHYLIDAQGYVRHIKFGEGDYDVTERLIRELLTDANKNVTLGDSTEKADSTPTEKTTPETYFGAGKAKGYAGKDPYTSGESRYTMPKSLPVDKFALGGTWKLNAESLTAIGNGDLRLHYRAKEVYLVVSGEGTVSVTENGKRRQVKVSGIPTLYQVADNDELTDSEIELSIPDGLQIYSFTFG